MSPTLFVLYIYFHIGGIIPNCELQKVRSTSVLSLQNFDLDFYQL